MSPKKTIFAVLQFQDLRLFLLECLISFTGSYMQVVGIGWHVYQLTHSAFYLGILGLVRFIPSLIAFLPMGVIVDVYHKKMFFPFQNLC